MAIKTKSIFKKLTAIAYGLGAAVVIAGALFKIMHWPGADTMLIAGMGTEVLIFLVSAFEPVYDDYKWEVVYPELADDALQASSKGKSGGSVTQQLDVMLKGANVEQDMIKRLGENLGKLSDNIKSMNSVADAAGATHEYSASAKSAAVALSSLKDSFAASAASAKDLESATAGTKEYHAQVQTITKNLSQLNSMYELEIQDANNHVKAMNKFIGNLADAMASLESTKTDAVSLKDNMSSLSKNLTSLNTVYGSMLSAMRG